MDGNDREGGSQKTVVHVGTNTMGRKGDVVMQT